VWPLYRLGRSEKDWAKRKQGEGDADDAWRDPRELQVGLALFSTLFSPELGLWVGTFHVIQSRTRIMGWHFSRYFAVKSTT
jgi:hypothetical protein